MRAKLLKHKSKFLAIAVIAAILAIAFFWGGNYPQATQSTTSESASIVTDTPASDIPEQSSLPDTSNADALDSTSPEGVDKDSGDKGGKDASATKDMRIDPKTGKDKYHTAPVPKGAPVPVEPQEAVTTNKAMTCTLSIRCDTILSNMNLLNQEKHQLVPQGGVIFSAKTVTFYEGESVFNVLQREMKKAKIHMEFENPPLYNSAYIEGINNLYELDVGELSGWVYKVNGWFPNYGCSRYQLKDGDVVEWMYTCNQGRDVGGTNAIGG